ncbi:hypothetical protein BDN72DRAFT_859836 [Pluteus cervinus]|uniref:Uncharacterized protein n=1 Tax=Pluteus cervinus TaxID=181527 RepID=A0ACD3ALS4_9AGAR|nr:hypothetical protein BDN72DRAFT_859836 [Pluteus cervinus]
MPLPRINSRTPLVNEVSDDKHTASNSPVLPLHNDSPKTSLRFLSSMNITLSTFSPRKSRHRTAFLALIALVLLSTYAICLNVQPFSQSPAVPSSQLSSADRIAAALENLRKSRLGDVNPNGVSPVLEDDNDDTKDGVSASSSSSSWWSSSSSSSGSNRGSSGSSREQIKLSEAEELAAVSSFLASLPQNVLPPHVDPSLPLDPQLILDFDTTSSRAHDEVQTLVNDVWARNPVFLYAKHFSATSREAKSILSGYNLRPEPTIIDVDVRDDADVLGPLLTRLTHLDDLPVLLIGGKVIGGIEEMRLARASGELKELIQEAGGIVDGKKPKGGRKH